MHDVDEAFTGRLKKQMERIRLGQIPSRVNGEVRRHEEEGQGVLHCQAFAGRLDVVLPPEA